MITRVLRVGRTTHGFEVDRVEEIPELRSRAAVFTHQKTGAHVVHLLNDDPNNLFCVGFRTPVYDNTGVPHIIEHSVLAGSEKFPLKDPFKEMLKGSLQTFLNAITYPDKTIYPVSSQVERDFYNLVDVYCDAVFHPLLSELTFLQEGWHFDLENPDDPVSIKGIVYNEMRGVFSDFRSHVSRKSMSNLLPDTTYFYESGGEPESITDLTYQAFRAFHEQYYHPSNAFILLYGNIPPQKTLEFLHTRYLVGYDRRPVDSVVKPQVVWHEPRRIELSAPAPREDDGTASVIVCWLFGDATDPLTMLLGRIFSHYLLDTQTSPLRRALVDSKLGEDLDDMTGFEDDLAQAMFCAGLRRTKPKHADEIRRLVFDTLDREIERGLDPELLEGSVRQVEFCLREIADAGSFPYNLILAERCYRSWIHGGDPIAHLRFGPLLETVKKHKAQGTGFFVGKLRELLLDNPHHLLSVVKASSELGASLGKKTQEQAARLSKSFTDSDRRHYHQVTLDLLTAQKAAPSPEAVASLPKLCKEDLPPEGEKVPTLIEQRAGIEMHAHPLFTAGIVYLDICFDLSCLPLNLLPYYPLYSELLTRCGAAGFSYQEMAKRISLATGGIGCSDMCATRFGAADQVVFEGFFHGKALPERVDDMLGILRDLFCRPRLDDHKLIRDILFEMRNEMSASVLRSGHLFAVGHAAATLTGSNHVNEILDGVAQLRFLDRLVEQDDTDSIHNAMEQVHRTVVSRDKCLMVVTCEDPDSMWKRMDDFVGNLPPGQEQVVQEREPSPAQTEPVAIEISSSVNYVARCVGQDQVTARDMGRLYLLARNLSTGFLWDRVRVEGGAYGGMATVTASHPVFSCASYRDPNLTRTLDNFRDCLAYVAAGLPEDEVNQNIIGTIGKIDHPRNPHSKGLGESVALLCGRIPSVRQELREAVLNCGPKDLVRVAEKLIESKRTAVVVLGSKDAFDKAAGEGFRFRRTSLLESPAH